MDALFGGPTLKQFWVNLNNLFSYYFYKLVLYINNIARHTH